MDIMTGIGLVSGFIVIATMMLLGGDLHCFSCREHRFELCFGQKLQEMIANERSLCRPGAFTDMMS